MDIIVGILLSIVGIGMIGFWIIHGLKGGLPQGIRTVENGGYIAFHVSAELLTGGLCLLSGILLILDYDFGDSTALFAAGMLLYTSINSLAWKEVKNKPLNAAMFIVPAFISIFSILYLLFF